MKSNIAEKATVTPIAKRAAFVPPNILIDGVPAETVARVAIMLKWLHLHPLRQVDGGYSEHVTDTLRCGDAPIKDMMVDALEHVAAQLEGA